MRVSKVKTPILILSGLAGIEDKVKGLGFGADDYMTKPFHKDELIARIHAIVRRSKGHAQSVINTGDLVVNLDTKTVEVGGQRVHLTGKEYQMLELLSLRKGTTLTKEMFLNHLYGGMDEPELKIIDVFICKLRKKLANASCGQELHRDGVGPRLRAARAERGRRANSGLSFLSAPAGMQIQTPPETAGFFHGGPGCRDLVRVIAFYAGHGRGQKQQDENAADNLKCQHRLILWSRSLHQPSIGRRLRSIAARAISIRHLKTPISLII